MASPELPRKGLTKAQFKKFAGKADDILDKFDRATNFNPYSFWSWCSEAAEFVPIAGDAYGGIKFGKAIVDAKSDLKALERKIDAAKAAARKRKAAPKKGLTGGSQGRKMPNSELKAPPAKRGNAPIGADGHPVELHHRGQKPDSPLDEMTRKDHRGKGNFKKNHENTGQSPSEIDRKEWKKEQKQYWRDEWDSGRFDEGS